jgi:CRP-like cAMP-binding protein
MISNAMGVLPSHLHETEFGYDSFTHSEGSLSFLRTQQQQSSPASIWKFLKGENTGWSSNSYARNRSIHIQGEAADAVYFLVEGWVKISTVSSHGKLAVLGLLTGGDVLGEYCASGDSCHGATATAIEPATVVRVERHLLQNMLQHNPGFPQYFVQILLKRNRILESGLVNQLLHSSEKRLAQIFYELASRNHGVLPRVSQETLAGMVGTTRSRISYFMNRMRRSGILKESGRTTISIPLLARFLEEA